MLAPMLRTTGILISIATRVSTGHRRATWTSLRRDLLRVPLIQPHAGAGDSQALVPGCWGRRWSLNQGTPTSWWPDPAPVSGVPRARRGPRLARPSRFGDFGSIAVSIALSVNVAGGAVVQDELNALADERSSTIVQLRCAACYKIRGHRGLALSLRCRWRRAASLRFLSRPTHYWGWTGTGAVLMRSIPTSLIGVALDGSTDTHRLKPSITPVKLHLSVNARKRDLALSSSHATFALSSQGARDLSPRRRGRGALAAGPGSQDRAVEMASGR